MLAERGVGESRQNVADSNLLSELHESMERARTAAFLAE